MKSLFFALIACLAFTAIAQDGTIYPLETPKEPNAIPLNTGSVKDQPAPETWFRQWGDPMARNISTATLTPFFPEKGKANGAAVIVAPGGGYRWLSMGNEGWEVAEALAKKGITAFVLKYRLFPTPEKLVDFTAWMNRPRPAPQKSDSTAKNTNPMAQMDLTNQLADAEAAYAMILKNAAAWGVDKERIGMIGFSAGAGLTMHATLHSKTMTLAFIGPIYGGMGPVKVPKNAPPMFNAIASDDFLFNSQFGVIESWFKAGRPVEFHLYQNGGHGFGLGNPNRTSNKWFDAFVHWLDVNKFLGWTGTARNTEIDFVGITPTGEIEYYQIAWQLASENTIEREFSALERITDNYPKYLLSTDSFKQDRSGIKHLNVFEWLLGN
jgi:acetyl esterase/lipase